MIPTKRLKMDPTADADERDHAVEMLRTLNGMRVTKEHCDFTIRVGNEEIPAHRNVLSAGSDYFQKMLSHENVESSSGVVTMKDVPMASVRDCINFIYTGQVPVTDENCEQLMHVADIMQLKKMCNKIEIFLDEELSPGSFYTTKMIADTFNCAGLVESCNKFALKYFQWIVVQDGFKQSDKEFISFLVKAKETKVSEAVKCKALIIWTNYNIDARRSAFEELFDRLNLSEISRSYRKFIVEKESLVFNSAHCLKSILTTMVTPYAGPGVEAADIDLNKAALVDRRKPPNAIAVFDEISKSIQAFVPQNKTWRRVKAISDDFVHKGFTAVLLGDIIYVLVNDETNYQLDYTDADATWVTLPNRILTRGIVAAVAFGGSIYAFDDFDETSKTVEKFDPSDGTWSHVTDKPVEGGGTSVVATEDFIYCIGGYNGTRLSDARKYNPSDSTWTTLSPIPTARYGAAAVELDGKIYVIGGYNVNYLDIVECFDTVAQTWTSVARLNNVRYGFKACVVEGKIFVVGGSPSNDTIEELDPAENNWVVIETMNGKDINPLASIALNLPL